MAKPTVVERKLDYLTEKELATELGVVKQTIKRWRIRGEGPPFTRIGRRPVYLTAAVQRWLQSRERAIQQQAAE